MTTKKDKVFVILELTNSREEVVNALNSLVEAIAKMVESSTGSDLLVRVVRETGKEEIAKLIDVYASTISQYATDDQLDNFIEMFSAPRYRDYLNVVTAAKPEFEKSVETWGDAFTAKMIARAEKEGVS